MGCGSQTGCLGPKPREREVYLDLVDTIHQEAIKMEIPQNQDSYAFVKGRLNKKGWIKKLIDNLVSHKSNLYECANQILDISMAANSLAEHTACLVVVDKIIDEFYREQEQSQSKEKDMKKSITTQILPTLLSMALPSYNEVPIDMVQRMNIAYFKTVIVLMQKEKIPSKDILSSLSNFLSLKTDKILCKIQIFRLFELLIQNIKQKTMILQSAHIFGQLLSRIKQNLCNQINLEYIVFFVKSWFFKKTSTEATQGYRKVLEEFLKNSSGNTEFIVQTFISVLDEVCFDRKEAERVEQLISCSFENEDSSKYLIRSMAVELIKYLQVGEEENIEFCRRFKNLQNEQCRLNSFKLITKWILEGYLGVDTTIEYNPSSIINFFVDYQIKSSSQAIREEFVKQYFKIIERTSPESVVILTNLLASLIKQKQIDKKKREVLFTLLQQIVKTKIQALKEQDYSVKSAFLLSIERHYPKEMKLQLLSFAVRGIRHLNILKIKTNPQVYEMFRLKMCQFLYSIFDVIINIFQNSDASSENSLNNSEDSVKRVKRLSFLHKFVDQVQQTFKYFNDHHLQAYLLCFLDCVNLFLKDLNPNDEKEAILLYFLDYLIESSLFAMNKKERVNELISKMGAMLEKESLMTHELRNKIIMTVQEMVQDSSKMMMIGESDTNSLPELGEHATSLIVQRNQKKISATKELFLIKETEWKEIGNSFKELFGGTLRESRKRLDSEVFAEKDFNRMSTLNMSLNEIENEKGSTRNEAEDSFREIMDKIRHQ